MMKEFMELACQDALEGIRKGDGGPFGAVVVKDGKIIASGHNMVLSTRDSTAHAEITAIRNAEKMLGTYDLKGCELYTSSYPCPMCLGAILWARIGKVYFGNSQEEAARIGFDDKAFYEAIASEDTNGLTKLEHVECEECGKLFNEWYKMGERRLY